MMKVKPVIYEGIHFRSKLEARWYIFMKKLGWNIIYEPEIEGLNGWLPDFLIIGKKHKILVDVKPIDKVEEWENHPDKNKILNSGIQNLHDYELMILGTNLQLDEDDSMGIFYIRPNKYEFEYMKSHDLYEDGNLIFSYAGNSCSSGIGIMTHYQGWMCRISGEGGKTYIFRDNNKEQFKKIDTYWNQAWSILRWKGKEVA